jgi:aspartate-semialdehyde dehydrogenase
MRTYNLALVGATGLVGQEILRVLEERHFPVGTVKLFASMCSEGSRVEFLNQYHVVRTPSNEAFVGADIAIFAASPEASRDYAPRAVRAGAVVVDTSAAFRHDTSVPLCTPALNPAILRQHRGIVALPHGMTAQLATVLAPLHAAATLERVVVSTYQSVSGRGRLGVQEFDQQLRDVLNFRPPQVHILPHQIIFNCLPQCGAFVEDGYTEEEMALIEETPRLLDCPELRLTATAVHVPMAHCHAAAITVETSRALSVAEARTLLAEAPGVVVEDDWKRLHYPLTMRAAGQDDIFVGRIRQDFSVPHGLQLWAVSDNLRQGAAVDAVQIAEHLIDAGASGNELGVH